MLRNILDAHLNIGVTPELHFFDRMLRGAAEDNYFKNSTEKDRVIEKVLRYIRKKKISNSELWSRLEFEPNGIRKKLEAANSLDDIYTIIIQNINTSTNPEAGVYIEKTPINLFFLDRIKSFFPDAKIIHILRDGREVCASAAKRWQLNYLEGAARWVESIREPEKAKGKYGGQDWLDIKYEDLAQNTADNVRQIMSFIGITDLSDYFWQNLSKLSGTSSFGRQEKAGVYYSKNFERFFTDKQKRNLNGLLAPYLEKYNYPAENTRPSSVSRMELTARRWKWRRFIASRYW